ncbi:kinase-like domain-containing protein [Xylariaceae sp. FL0662B]|nr:kinase-like domain-containing protein [Xylariaceae sp. FL0662B]
MAPLEQSEKDELTARILQQLSKTPYACSSLAQLTNGTTNFVFRGTLTKPFSYTLQPQNDFDQSTATARTVIVKYSTDFAALNKDIPIDSSRSTVEGIMLGRILNGFPYTASIVKIPQLYLFDQETNTQVLEDIPGAVDLKEVFKSPTANVVLSKSFATSIGRALGSWLRSFHSWTSARPHDDLRPDVEIGHNEPMRELKYRITYGSFINVLEEFPDVLDDHKKTLEEVKTSVTNDFKKTASDEQGEEWGVIHGDFWTGNVLLPEGQQPEETKLYIIDWEFTQFGHRAYDIGQMIGDLYELKHFKDIEAALWAIDAFVQSYGTMDEEMAFRVSIHTGVQLITWVTRGPPLHMRPAWATRERVAAIVKLGMTFILKGWEKDRDWFQSSVLAGLFVQRQ